MKANHSLFCDCKAVRGFEAPLRNGLLIHKNCERPLRCSKCNKDIAVYWAGGKVECRKCSSLFTDKFFSKSLDVEKLIDAFIYYAGGKRVVDFIEGPNPPSNADYFFETENVLLELKILETEFAEQEEHYEKFKKLVLQWMSDNRLSYRAVFGLEPLPEAFIHAHLRLFVPALQRITNKANNQIKKSKEILSVPDAKGVVLYLDEGFIQVSPSTLAALIGDPLNRMMSGVDAFVLFSLRQRIRIQGETGARLFWDPRYRDAENSGDLSIFINRLGAQYLEFLQELGNQKFKDVPLPDLPHEEIFRSMQFIRSS